jgi:tetratricopeptide (TPR) repeat protein
LGQAHTKRPSPTSSALRTDPTSDEAYLGLARAQDRLGLAEAAEQTYRRAVDLRPTYWVSRNWLGAFYRGHARYELAIQQYEQAVQLTPDNALAYAFLSGIYALVGRYAESLVAAETSLTIVPTTYGYVGQGMTLYRLRRFADAVTALERLKNCGQTFAVSAISPGPVIGRAIATALARSIRRRLR